ncbi:OmpA family protein [Hansschlegelia quercus]|uniref:OmpA family protein n=2 Tax=Hansschlegelia quercus TaxID=2528245 RepID=A0A4Q9GLX2_9HYPH|nr:OmpA family protein [Hansschlegelia quercus]
MREDRRDDQADRRRRDDDRIDRVRGERRERRDGDVTIITEGDRTIYRDGGRTYIRRDENLRFREGARDVREERDGDTVRTVVTRPDGSKVVTVTDRDGQLISRTRTTVTGEDYVLIDNRPRGGGRRGGFVDLGLAPPRVSIPRERYIVDADDASYEQIDEAFSAPPVERLDRSYSLDEIRQNAPLRERVRSVDLDTVTFDTGSWDVRDDQIKKLENVGLAMESAIKKNPRTVFMVEGHTDAVGNDDDNLSLSDRRAQAVAEILTKYFTIPAENLTTQGYGEQYLKVKTDGPEERNRRVTVRNITQLLTSEK